MGATVVRSVTTRNSSVATALTVVAVVWAGCCCHLAATFACPPAVCVCRWKGGKETAECVGKRLDKIPGGLSRGTQVLDVSKNNLKELPKEAFFNEGLLNLQKVHVTDCKIRKIHDNAFSHLANLVELDLGNNLLIAIPSETFVDYPGLRRLSLNHNPIRRVESNAFVKLPSLAHLELSACFLEYVGPRAFHGLHHLQHLKLDANKLTTLPADVGFPIPSLLSLDLFDNPWLCDCRLRVLRNWLGADELPVNAPPKCADPPRLVGRQLLQVPATDYACPPQVAPSQSQSPIAEAYVGESASLVCSIHADPPAEVRWTRNGRSLLNATAVAKPAMSSRSSNSARTVNYVVHERGSVDRTSVLTMSVVGGAEDAGEYLCVAENVAGTVVVNITLEVSTRQIEASSLSNGHIAGLSVGLIVVSAATIVFICILLAKMRQQRSDETKHLHDLDAKKQHHQHQVATANHVVNHVKFDVTKDKLEINSGPGGGSNGTENNSVHKPLCSANQVNNYSSNATPPQDGPFHLEDSIGGCFRSTSNSSFTATRLIGSKPDVVNFTPDNDGRMATGQHLSRHNSPTSPPNHTTMAEVGTPRDGESTESRPADANTSPLYYSSCKDGLITSSSFRSPTNDDDERRLCDYVQLYEETCLAATSASKAQQRSAPSSGGGLNSVTRVTSPPHHHHHHQLRERRTDFGDADDDDWAQRHLVEDDGGNEECGSVVQRAPAGCRRWYGSVEEHESRALVSASNEDDGTVTGAVVGAGTANNNSKNNSRSGRSSQPPPVPAKPRHGPPAGHAVGPGILKHANLHGRNYVPVLPPLPVHHFAQARDSPDEGYEDEVEEEMDM